jgi:antibiotic biosynthesis monooxygenase (ABM) superfamily enzyme
MFCNDVGIRGHVLAAFYYILPALILMPKTIETIFLILLATVGTIVLIAIICFVFVPLGCNLFELFGRIQRNKKN